MIHQNRKKRRNMGAREQYGVDDDQRSSRSRSPAERRPTASVRWHVGRVRHYYLTVFLHNTLPWLTGYQTLWKDLNAIKQCTSTPSSGFASLKILCCSICLANQSRITSINIAMIQSTVTRCCKALSVRSSTLIVFDR